MIKLTNKGWKGSKSGSWSKKADKAIDKSDGVFCGTSVTARSVAGDDNITGIQNNGKNGIGVRLNGELLMGADDDKLTGKGNAGIGLFVDNFGSLDMGNGDDKLVGGGKRGAIVNRNLITMGLGKDLVNAAQGGFSGGGEIQMEEGNDTAKGFGSQTVDGGDGKDKIIFNNGTYKFTEIDGNEFEVINGGETMTLIDLELVGGKKGSLVSLQAGTLSVVNGVGEFS